LDLRGRKWHWRRLHDEELHNLYASPNIISDQVRKNEMDGTCSKHEREMRNKVKVKLSLCLTKNHAMKAYWGVEV
jgi:hypothetical protein